jgi:hypothetical protein
MPAAVSAGVPRRCMTPDSDLMPPHGRGSQVQSPLSLDLASVRRAVVIGGKPLGKSVVTGRDLEPVLAGPARLV